MAAVVTEMFDTRVGSIELRRSDDWFDRAGGTDGTDGDEGAGGSGGAMPVVYLHSAMGENRGLDFVDRLAEHHPVVAPIFPGFPDSEGLEHIDDMDDAVFHLLDLWERLGLEAPAVVGLSLGGWMAAEMATRYPEKVGSLVLVNPAGLYLPGHEIGDIFGRSPGTLATDIFYDQSHPVAQAMHGINELTADVGRTIELPIDVILPVAKTLGAVAKLGWDPYLHNPKLPRRLWRVTCPTLVVHSTEDHLIPPAHCQYYADNIAGARHVEVPEAGHMLPWEKPEDLATLIHDFLTRN
jgi:pimeloyl-ACP methyl ester carboxylesterase